MKTMGWIVSPSGTPFSWRRDSLAGLPATKAAENKDAVMKVGFILMVGLGVECHGYMAWWLW